MPLQCRICNSLRGVYMFSHIQKIGIVPVVILFLMAAPELHAADLDDDGISNYTDDSIKKYSELGKPEPNVSFIIVNAKSKAKVLSKKGEEAAKGGGIQQPGQANLNSVVLGAGGTVRGDIIIIDEGRGDKTAIAE